MIRNAIASFLCVALMALPACMNEALPPSGNTTNNGNPLPSGDDSINGGVIGNNDGDSNSEGGPVVVVNTDPLSRHVARVAMPDGSILDCWVQRDDAGNIEYASHFRALSSDGRVEYLQIDELGRPVQFVDSLGFGFRVDEYLDDDQALVTYFNASGEEAQAIVDLATSQGNGLAIDQKAHRTAKALNQNAARWPSDRLCEALRAGIDGACKTSDIISLITTAACVVGGPVGCIWSSIGEFLITTMLCYISEFAVDDVCSRAKREPLGEPNPPVDSEPEPDDQPEPLPCVGTFTDSQGDICGWVTFTVDYPDNNWYSTWVTMEDVCASSTSVGDNHIVLTGQAMGEVGGARPVGCITIQLMFEIDLQVDARVSPTMCSMSPYHIPLSQTVDGWISLTITQYDLFGNVFEDHAFWSPPPFEEGPLMANVHVYCDTGELKRLSFLPSFETTTAQGGRITWRHFQVGSW